MFPFAFVADDSNGRAAAAAEEGTAAPGPFFTAGGVEWNAALARARRVRRICEMASAGAAVLVTALVCTFRITTRAAAYSLLIYTGVFFEFLRRGGLAVAARSLAAMATASASAPAPAPAPATADTVTGELRSAYAFAWLSAVWLCWIAGNELLLTTGALAGGEPFGEGLGTAIGLLHLALALAVSWPTLAPHTADAMASEVAFPLLLASALLLPTSKSALQSTGAGVFMAAVVRTGGAFGALFVLQGRSDLADAWLLPPLSRPLSSHGHQLRAARTVVQTGWMLLAPAPFLFAVLVIFLLHEHGFKVSAAAAASASAAAAPARSMLQRQRRRDEHKEPPVRTRRLAKAGKGSSSSASESGGGGGDSQARQRRAHAVSATTTTMPATAMATGKRNGTVRSRTGQTSALYDKEAARSLVRAAEQLVNGDGEDNAEQSQQELLELLNLDSDADN